MSNQTTNIMTTSEIEAKRAEMIQIYSDFHKEAYGFRPRGINYHEFSLEQLQEDFDSFSALCEQNEREEEARDNYALAEFEKRVQSVIDMGAGDRQTALRWIVESYEDADFGYGAEFFVAFEMGLGQNDRSKAIAKELEPVIKPLEAKQYFERYAQYDEVA